MENYVNAGNSDSTQTTPAGGNDSPSGEEQLEFDFGGVGL